MGGHSTSNASHSCSQPLCWGRTTHAASSGMGVGIEQACHVPQSDEATWVPETSVVVAGLGGLPAVILLVTPLRNALTLATNNPTYSTMQCYRQVFRSAPFRGGSSMAYAAIPASIALGPAYHMF